MAQSSIRERLHELRHQIETLARHYNATNVRVFGSVARQSDSSASDVDLLVTFLPGATLYDMMGLELAIEALLGTPVDIASDDGLAEGSRERIVSEAVPL